MNRLLARRSVCLAMLAGFATPKSLWAQDAAPLEIGVLPNISARVLLAQYQPMREYLAREMRRAIQVSTAPNWNAFQKRTADYELDVVVTAAHLARLAQIDRGYIPLLSYAPNIKGLVAFAKDRPLPSVAALRGQTLVLSNAQSLVTFRGMRWLAENGLQRDRDFKTINTPTEDSVGNVVVRGDAIAAMLSAGEFRATADAIRAKLEVLTVFAEVPSFVVMASPRLPAKDARAVKDQLLRFASASDEGKLFFSNTGFTGVRELEPGLMESMDPYIDPTRKAL